MWVRGLKLVKQINSITAIIVAPHVGAWIETKVSGVITTLSDVAPHVGAWIETRFTRRQYTRYSGRTPCGCVD